MSRQKEDALFSAHAILAALRSSIRILRWGMLVLVAFYLCSGITMVGPNERALILRFGRVLPQSAPPGLLFALPPPIDEVVLLPAKSVQEVGLDLWTTKADGSWRDTLHPVRDPYTLTGDVNIIRARFSVRYQVADAAAYEFGATERDKLRDAILYRSACRTLAGMGVDDVLTTRRDFIGQEAMREAQTQFDRLGLGLQLLAFETREINPPAQILSAFQDVVSAKVEAGTLIEPAKSKRASQIPQARAEAYRLEQEAQSWAQGVISRAEGKTAAFLALLAEYRKNPETVYTRLYAEMIEVVLPKVRMSSVMPSGRGELRVLIAPQKPSTLAGEEEADSDELEMLPSSSFAPGSDPSSNRYPRNIQPMEDEH